MSDSLKVPELKIVNRDLHFEKVSLVEPTGHFYLQIAAEVDRPITPFFLWTSAKKKSLLKTCKRCCAQIKNETDTVDASVFKACLLPPGRGKLVKERKGKVHVARFDVAVLIEVKSEEVLDAVKINSSFREMAEAIRGASSFVHSITASNVKCINTVGHARPGIFLFNYFYADSLRQNLAVWEYTAGWFQQETGLDNSTVLLPTDPEKSNYAIINHCRWDKLSDIVPSLLFKKTFHTYVLDNFYANDVAALPVLYRLA